MRSLWALLVLICVACGGSEPTRPSPAPAPPPAAAASAVTISGTTTSTVTGQSVGTFSTTATSLPVQVSVSLPGYITRETWITSARPTVDLFPEAGFELAFYRQFARDAFDRPSGLQGLRVLSQVPGFYLEVEGAKGVSAATAARLEQMARRTVPLLTGGRFQVTRWETGPTARAPQPGWIMVERSDLAGNRCGQALVGASAGQIRLDNDTACNIDAVFAHEIGHALGFWHVDRPGHLMYPQQRASNLSDAPTERERLHAALAYARVSGNQDIDRDPQRPTSPPPQTAVD